MESLPVIFRACPDEGLNALLKTTCVIALFPTVPAYVPDRDLCLCHLNIGIKGPAHYSYVVASTRPATGALADELHAELVRIGYKNLDTHKRVAPWMHKKRRDNIRKMEDWEWI